VVRIGPDDPERQDSSNTAADLEEFQPYPLATNAIPKDEHNIA
jgi:hypothetical protein